MFTDFQVSSQQPRAESWWHENRREKQHLGERLRLNRRLKEKTSKDGGFDHGPSATRAKVAAGTNKI